MGKQKDKLNELNNANELPEEGTMDPTGANPAAGGAVEPQETGAAPQPSVDHTEGSAAAEGTEAPQKGVDEAGVAMKYRVNYRYGLNLRTGPGREHKVIRVLPNGTEILVFGDAVAVGPVVWCQTEGGWVDSTYLISVEEG